MKITILRGRVLSFLEEPQGRDDHASYRYIEDGAVVIGDGKILMVGEWNERAASHHDAAEIIDHRPNLILPGFIDPHIHFPQMQVIGAYAAALLEWLNTYTFVEEQRFGDEAHSTRIASRFFDELIRHGTTTAAAYCSVHPQSVDAFFGEAEKRNMLMVGGKVMMDRNAPPGLLDTPQSGYDDTKAGIAKWHGRGRAHYAITPRFAITSTHEQMAMAEALAREFPDLHIQTHVSENLAEIAYANELFPNYGDYVGIYEKFHLLGPKTLLGHCIHLSHRETEVISESRSVAVFCPTSNLFIGSGLFDYERQHERGVRIATATDVGGGSSYSMLRTMDEGYKVMQLRGQRLTPFRSFFHMTLGNARAMSLDGRIGSLEPGKEADIVVLDSSATPQMALRMETCGSLEQELFLLQTCGDDRAVVETYVMGKPMKSALAA
ncbi:MULTISPECIES: guanine deaminase [unclassified Devosia]|uniref:guanine deaminase n=1 Tax=unclassified Devosia TaxID=196773 RepID=UPI00095E67F2|nr:MULTISPECIES: guanine deaminase [unclassified Devosia]MBN9364093.1 guanine deaminase [Devosia sp.]OJX27343.1 MAG: guanine deaminase [Devosia sp. 66-14]